MPSPTRFLEPGLYEMHTLDGQAFIILDSRRHDTQYMHRVLPWVVINAQGQLVGQYMSLTDAKHDTWHNHVEDDDAEAKD